MKLIDKDALVAEIKRKKKSASPAHFCKETYEDGYYRGLNEALFTIKSLEVKEVDFEREMQTFAKINLEPLVISDSNIGISITMNQLYGCAKHFFKLGMSVSNKAQKGEKV